MITLEPPEGTPETPQAWKTLGLSRAGLLRFLSSAIGLVGLRGEVNVLLAGDTTLKRLNASFRGKNKPTDVLSFPSIEPVSSRHSGDLAISLDTAARQATEHGHPLAAEVRILMLHGLLHLAGMDHETDQGEMATREAELRKRLRLPANLIARTQAIKAGART